MESSCLDARLPSAGPRPSAPLPPTDSTDLHSLLAILERALRQQRVCCPRAEAEWLLGDCLGLGRTELYLHGDAQLDPRRLDVLWTRLQRRVQAEPLQYVLGYTEFMGHRLAVDRSVLVPRPETEVLVEESIGCLRRRLAAGLARPRVLDVGTGSGNIAVSLAHAIPSCLVEAVELSWEALRTARANVLSHGLQDRIQLVRADWTSALRGPFDLIVSNPPYVRSDEMDALPSDVTREPRLSLEGGADGMAFHRRLVADAERLLTPGATLSLECAEGQAALLCEFARSRSWVRQARVFKDLTGRSRGLIIQRK